MEFLLAGPLGFYRPNEEEPAVYLTGESP